MEEKGESVKKAVKTTVNSNRRSNQMVSIRVTRKEFLALPMRIRRRALRDHVEKLKHDRYLDTLDCEEDP